MPLQVGMEEGQRLSVLVGCSIASTARRKSHYFFVTPSSLCSTVWEFRPATTPNVRQHVYVMCWSLHGMELRETPVRARMTW